MSLTGITLIVLAFLALAVVAALTVLGWRRFGAARYVVRAGGILLVQALLIASIGLVVNRSEGFYPSWAALSGNAGTTAAQQDRAVGRLDGELAGGAVTWRPTGAGAWHLAGRAALSVPSGYEAPASASLSYPVVVELRPPGRTAAPGAVTVILPVTAKTTVKSLASLPAELAGDVRVGAGGWAVVAPVSLAALAEGLARTAPQRYVAVALVGGALPAGAAVTPRSTFAPAGARTRRGASPAAPGRAHSRRSPRTPRPRSSGAAPGGAFAVRTEPGWPAAVTWAAGLTAAPLAAPVVLPRAPRS